MGLIQTGWPGLAARFLLARKARALLTTAAIALGATLMAAVLTLGATLEAAIVDQMREQFGTFDVLVGAPSVTTGVIDADTVAGVQAIPGVAYTVPLLVRPSVSDQTPVRFYSGVGHFPPGQQGVRLLQGRLPEAGEVVLPDYVADRLGVALGGTVTLPFPDGDHTLRLVGLVSGAGQPATALLPYEWLSQELHLGGPSFLLVGLRPGASKQRFAADLQARYPAMGVDLRRQVDEWRNNLGGFGMLGRLLGGGALITSGFLVLGAFGITVQERTRELAMMRAVGARRSQVMRLVLAEALLIGAAGATGGVAVGLLGAAGLIDVVSLRLGVPGHRLVIPTAGLVGVWVATVLLALAGAWPAARRAGGVSPLAAMRPDTPAEEHRTRVGSRVTLLLLLLAGATVGYSYRPELDVPQQFMLGVLAAILLLVGVLLALPRLLPNLTGLLAAAMGRWLPVQVAIGQRNLERHQERAARTAGVMVLGLATLISVAGLITTETVSKEQNMRAMFPTGAQISGPWASPMGYGDDIVGQVGSVPGVADAIPLGREVEADLVGYDSGRARPAWVEQLRRNGQVPERVWLQPVDYAALERVYPYGAVDGTLHGGIVLTRQLASDMGLKLGDRLRVRLNGQQREHMLTITALVDHLPMGMVLAVDAESARRELGLAPQYRTTLVQVAPGADRTAVKTVIQALLGTRYAAFTYQDLTDMLDQGRQRQQQNLAMVTAAAIILLVIAAVGLVNTVTAAMRERQRELAVVRAVGATPSQTAWLVVLEMLLLGSAGSLTGTILGSLMITVIWLHGIQAGQGVALPWGLMLLGALSGPALAVLAALSPVYRLLRNSPSEALQAE